MVDINKLTQDIDKFVQWSREGCRTVEIKLGDTSNPNYIMIWAYDFTLRHGQSVKSFDELDIAGDKKRKEEAEFERLKNLYA